MINRHISKKAYNIFSGSMILVVLILVTLGITLDFYPGGYSIQNDQAEKLTVIKKVLLQEEQYNFEVTSDNELKVSLLKYNINRLFSLWFTSLFVIAALMISLVFSYQRKLEKYFFLLIVFLIIIIPLDIYVIFHHFHNIEDVIEFLRENKKT